MTSAPELPDVELIAYRQTDPGDHPHGGQCVGFSGVETPDAWLLLVEQFRESLRHLVELAAREDQGDLLTRPMLFNAHHTVDLATKAALVAQHKPARRAGMAGRLRRVFGLQGLAKQPKALPVREGNDQRPSFSFEYADRGSTDDWHFSLDGDDAKTVVDFLCEMSRLSWKEIGAQQTGNRNRHRKHHDQEVASLCVEAQKRFSDLRLDHITDTVYRFRLSGESRLWGFVKERTFYVVWWDRTHQVYPTEPS